MYEPLILLDMTDLRLQRGQGADLCFPPSLFLSLIAAHNLEHWSIFRAFRATTSVHELFLLYLNPPELSLIFCHLAYLIQTIRTGFVFSAKAKLMLQNLLPFISRGAQSRISTQCMGGYACTQGKQGTPRHPGEPGQVPA